MNLGTQANFRSSRSSDMSMLKQQLEKEVVCLVSQLDSVRNDAMFVDLAVLKNYESMIDSRRKMLHNLPSQSLFRSAIAG